MFGSVCQSFREAYFGIHVDDHINEYDGKNLCEKGINETSSKDISPNNNRVQIEESEEETVNVVRTSTPIPVLQSIPGSISLDPVSNFFYQSWKNDLQNADQCSNQHQQLHQEQYQRQYQIQYQEQYRGHYQRHYQEQYLQHNQEQHKQPYEQLLVNQPNYQTQWGIQVPVQQIQVAYVNTVVQQTVTTYSYTAQVGYRSDGTFGILPPHW